MKKPVIFLDRDGVLTKEKSYILRKEDMEIFAYAKECIQKLHSAGYLAIVITNQSAIGRKMLDETELKEMNEILKKETSVDDVFYCPHWHPKAIICNCRKPQIGMILMTMKKYEIDLENSYFVGDRSSDIKTGKNAGIKTILLKSGYNIENIEDITPDYIFNDLLEFVNYLISQ